MDVIGLYFKVDQSITSLVQFLSNGTAKTKLVFLYSGELLNIDEQNGNTTGREGSRFGFTVSGSDYIKSIVTPLWFDYFKHSTFDFANITNGSWWKNCTLPILSYATATGINATFLLVGQFGFTMIVTGVILLNMMFMCPKTLSEKDYKYPKFKLFLIGFAMTMPSL